MFLASQCIQTGLVFIYGCFRLHGLVELHSSLRSEMWTWQLAESLLCDMVDTELRNENAATAEQEEIIDNIDHQLVS